MSKPETLMIDNQKYVRADMAEKPGPSSFRGAPYPETLIGMNVFIRTVTYHYTGWVADINGGFIQLTNAAWIADSGRFMNALRDGTLSEVEPMGEVLVSLASIVDISPWKHALPRTQK